MPNLLLDEFTTSASAPLATPRTCEPGPGTLDLSTATGLTIAGGALIKAGLVEQSIASGAGWIRSTGLAALFSTTYTAGGANYFVSFSERKTIGVDKAMPSYPNWWNVWETYGTQTEFALVLASFGTLWINRTTNKLVWVDVTGALDKSLLLHISSSDDSWAMNYLRVAQLGAPWNSDYGLATNHIAAPANPQATTSAANALVEFTWIPASNETLELDVRRTDADNRWIVRCTQASSDISLIERNAAVETLRAGATQTWTVGTGYRIVAAMDGDTIKVAVEGSVGTSYASATFNNTATGVNVAGFATGGDLIAWPRDVSAYPLDPGAAITITYTPILTRSAVAPPISVPVGTLCVSPTGNAAGDGSPANPYDLATGLANLTNGGTLLLLDGIYALADPPTITYLGRDGATLQTTISAAPNARPILTTASGTPPVIVLRARTTLDGIWMGGVRGNTDTVVQGGNDYIIRNCTFFNYYEGIIIGSQFRLQFLSNRFVNCGTGALQHDIYYTAQPVAPSGGTTIRNGIHVGGEGYKIQLWHDPTYCTVQNNFCATGNSGYCIVINGDGHTADHNTCWNGWMNVSTPTNSTIQKNVVGPNTIYTGSLGAGSTASGNVSTYPAALFGATPTQWLRSSWKANTGYSVDEINAAIKKLELAFQQTAADIWQDNGIEPLFTILAAVRDALADPGPQQGSPPQVAISQVVRHDRGGPPLSHRHKGGRNRRRAARSRRLTTR